MEKSNIEKEIKERVNDISLTIILSEIKENKIVTINSKVINSQFYKSNNYPIYSHFKSIIRY